MENSDNEICQAVDWTHKLSGNKKSCEICYTRMAIANNHTFLREGTRWAECLFPSIILVLLKSFKALLKIALNIRLETEDFHPVQVTSGTIHRKRQTQLD